MELSIGKNLRLCLVERSEPEYNIIDLNGVKYNYTNSDSFKDRGNEFDKSDFSFETMPIPQF